MKVISLFDGISCGLLALKKLGIAVDEYHSCEIDKFALKVSNTNHPEIIQHGCVTKFKGFNCDLLIGGSPCQGFSFAGKGLNFNDHRSKLFFEFVRVLKESKPKYFLLENVPMKMEYQNIITNELGVEPITINSNLLSAQNRIRLYWTNIKNVNQPVNIGKTIQDLTGIKNIKCGRIVGRRLRNGKRCDYDKTVPIIQRFEPRLDHTNSGCLTTVQKDNVFMVNGLVRKLTPNDYERLQTVPDNYTNCVSNTQRFKLLGNAWTVDVICHILKGIIK